MLSSSTTCIYARNEHQKVVFFVSALYARLHNGKIWIENDWTEEGLATGLLEHGVAPKDVVLAFHPPEMHVHTAFAVASTRLAGRLNGPRKPTSTVPFQRWGFKGQFCGAPGNDVTVRDENEVG